MLTLQTLADLYQTHAPEEASSVRTLQLGKSTFRPYPETSLMGVVNLSSDSWYRESVCLNEEAAVQRGLRLAAEGASIIDVGAESTLLHASRVDPREQQSLLLPVVRELASQNLVVSAETYHPDVAEHCLEAGASILNMTRGSDTEAIYRRVADRQAGVIICYLQDAENVREVGDLNLQDDHAGVLYEYFARETEKATQCGVENIWIDAGMGFYYPNLQDSAQRVCYQMKTLLQSFRLRSLGWPVCQALPHAFEYFEDEVRTAEAFFALLASLGQCDLLRTHEVAKVRGVLRSLQAYS